MDSKLVISQGALAILLLMPVVGLGSVAEGPAPVPTDLKWHVEQATNNIVRWTDRMSGFDPVKQVREGGSSLLTDMNHNVGRAVDGLLKGEVVTGKRTPGQVLDTLRAVLLATVDNEAGFPAAYNRQLKKMACSPHDIREAIQALLELAIRRGDQQAMGAAGQAPRHVASHHGPGGCLPAGSNSPNSPAGGKFKGAGHGHILRPRQTPIRPDRERGL